MLKGSQALTGWVVLDKACWNLDHNRVSHVGLLGPEVCVCG